MKAVAAMMKPLITLLLLLPALTGCSRQTMSSPDGRLSAAVFTTEEGALAWTVSRDGRMLCDTSALGVTVDGMATFRDVALRLAASGERDETYAVRGAHAEARDHAREYRWEVTHRPTNYRYTLETRLYDDGFAYRFILPGEGDRLVTGEAAQWRLPPDSRVWFAERNSAWKLLTYAGEWISAPAEALATVSPQGPVQTMPLLYETRDSLCLMVTEAALYEYSGMRLRAEADGSLRADFTEKEGFTLHDTITTPWRVLLVAGDLDRLVNTDLITNLNPAPDPALFADTSWVRPGRSLWSWWSGIDGRYMTVEGERAVIDAAAGLGYEYSTLDEGWESLPDKWATLRELAGYAAGKEVGLFVWRHWERLNDPADDYAEMRHFLDSVVACGVRGVKVDFMNGEGLRQIRFTTALLRNAAQRRLLVNFHGCQKPSGESRTYPNELTREGVRGHGTQPHHGPLPLAHAGCGSKGRPAGKPPGRREPQHPGLSQRRASVHTLRHRTGGLHARRLLDARRRTPGAAAGLCLPDRLAADDAGRKSVLPATGGAPATGRGVPADAAGLLGRDGRPAAEPDRASGTACPAVRRDVVSGGGGRGGDPGVGLARLPGSGRVDDDETRRRRQRRFQPGSPPHHRPGYAPTHPRTGRRACRPLRAVTEDPGDRTNGAAFFAQPRFLQAPAAAPTDNSANPSRSGDTASIRKESIPRRREKSGFGYNFTTKTGKSIYFFYI